MRSSTPQGAALLVALGMTALGFTVPARAQIPIEAGAVAMIAPSDAECIKSLNVRNPGRNHVVQQVCGSNRITVRVESGLSAVPDTVDITATTRFVVQIRVPRVPGSAEPSFVPIHVAVPVFWRGFLFNDNFIPNVETDATGTQGAHVNVNSFLQLFEGEPGRPGTRRRALETLVLQGASHAGASGCISIPKTKAQAAKLLARCVAAIWQRDEGDGLAQISAIVETGRTYDIELSLSGDLFTVNAGPGGGRTVPMPTPGGHPKVNFHRNPISGDAGGLYWTGPMVVTVGTDFEEGLQEVRAELMRLEQLIEELRDLFENHTHAYLTGRGVGHNRVEAETSPPND